MYSQTVLQQVDTVVLAVLVATYFDTVVYAASVVSVPAVFEFPTSTLPILSAVAVVETATLPILSAVAVVETANPLTLP